jgi:adenine-specific DNA-methyltransferase
VAVVAFAKTTGFATRYLPSVTDYLLWYARDKKNIKVRAVFWEKRIGTGGDENYRNIEDDSGKRRTLTQEEMTKAGLLSGKIYRIDHLLSQGATASEQKFVFEGRTFLPPANNHWKTTLEGLNRLAHA